MFTGRGQLLDPQGFQQLTNPYAHRPEQMGQVYQQHIMDAAPPFQPEVPDALYDVGQGHMPQASRPVSHMGSVYSSPSDDLQTQLAYQQQHAQQEQNVSPCKTFSGQFFHDPSQTHQMGVSGTSNSTCLPSDTTLYNHHMMVSRAYIHNSNLQPTLQLSSRPKMPAQAHRHHHHRLPNRPSLSTLNQTGLGNDLANVEGHGPPSMVGQPGMPEPAATPKVPKLKFTREDDALLVGLKETKNLTWKQIADFFPGRSSGTLQVRYSTKLKAKAIVWTEVMVESLRNALERYEYDRWRIISEKMGNGFSAAACNNKFDELNSLAIDRRGPDSSKYGGQSPLRVAEEQQQALYFRSALPLSPFDPHTS